MTGDSLCGCQPDSDKTGDNLLKARDEESGMPAGKNRLALSRDTLDLLKRVDIHSYLDTLGGSFPMRHSQPFVSSASIARDKKSFTGRDGAGPDLHHYN